MTRYFLFLFAFVTSLKFGFDYITSEKFQHYADQTKAPWTCEVTNYIGDLYQLMDSPLVAKSYYERVPARCPKTESEAKAVYGMAYSIDQMDQSREAMAAYNAFIEKYKGSPYVFQAQKNIARIQRAKSL